MRSIFFSIIWVLFALRSGAQTDTAIQRIQAITNDTARMNALYDYASSKIETDPKAGIAAGKILLDGAKEHNNISAMERANNIIAEGYEYLSDYPQSLKYYLEALNIQKEHKLYRAQIFSMLGISRIYDYTGNDANDKKYVLQAMDVVEANKANEQVQKTRCIVLGYMATIYKKEAKYDSAIKMYDESIELAKRDNNKTELMSSLCNEAIAFKSIKNFKASLDNYNKTLDLIDTIANVYDYGIVLDNMAILFYNMGDYAKSEQYSYHTIKLAQQTNNKELLQDVYDNLKNTYIKEKKYPEALDYFSKWSDLKDTLLNNQREQKIAELQIKFDAEAKDKEIAEQKKEIAYNRKINWSLAVSSTLFLLLGIFVYWGYASQKKFSASISKEKKRSEDLLLNILPPEVADELKEKGKADTRYYDHVTVMFTDFVNFTQASERMNPQDLIDELHFCFKAFDDIIGKYDIEKIKTIGDSYLAVSGLPVPDPKHAEHIVTAALEIDEFVRKRRLQLGDRAFEVRIGIHSGSVVAGIVGVKKFSYDIWGDTVNTAARMEQTSEPGKINISQTTYDLIKNKFRCTYRGEIEAKNKGKLGMYFVDSIIA